MNLNLKMKGAPCIRGLRAYKKGCPGKPWDGKEGCAAWHEDLITVKADETPEMRSFCIDVWAYYFRWWHEARLSGNQQAVESFRNNMTVSGSPRPDPGVLKLIDMIESQTKRDRIDSGVYKETPLISVNNENIS